MIRVVSFDVEGTLVTYDFSKTIWEKEIPRLYAEKKGLTFDKAEKIVRTEYERIGEKKVEWYDIKYWFKFFNLSNYEKTLLKFENKVIYYDDVIQILKDLNKKLKLIVISNSAKEFLNIQLSSINKYFSNIFSIPSDFLNLKNPKIYLKISKILGVKTSDIVHIGDRWNEDYIAPREIGVKSFLLDRKGEKSGKYVVNNLIIFKERLEKMI